MGDYHRNLVTGYLFKCKSLAEKPPSPNVITEATESLAGVAEYIAGLLRTRNWFKLLLLAEVALFFGFNEGSAVTSFLMQLAGREAPPSWYSNVFWLVLIGIFVLAVAIAIKIAPPTKKLEIKEGEARKAVKGLRAFNADDADIFAQLQREREIQNCLDSLNRQEFRFGILMGESGCGKTSLLQAGIVPRLNREESGCRGIYVRFSDRPPLATLCDAILEQLHPSADWQVKANQANLLDFLKESQRLAQQPLVLMFDQFEQVFTTRRQPAEQQQFIAALANWYKQGRPIPVKILISIRADLYHELFALQQAMGCTLSPYDVFKLEPFAPEEAVEVLQVIAETEGWAFDRSFVLRLATDELTTAESKISPVDLQILAETIRKQPIQQRALDEKTFCQLGGLEKLLENYVRETLEVLRLQRLYAPAVEILLTLIDRDRNVRTGALTLAELQTQLKGTATPQEVVQTTTWLASGDVRLISTVERSGERGYELAHERIIPAVLSLAGQTLEAAAKANRLLDRRVNEWLGNNRSRRYLFSLRELWLLRRQNQHLVWGRNQREKERLIKQSWQRVYRAGWAILIAIFLLLASFLVWLSPYGQMRQMQWELTRLSDKISPDAKLHATVAFAKIGNQEKSSKILETISRDSYTKAYALVEIAETYAQLQKSSLALEALSQAQGIVELLPSNQATWILMKTAEAYGQFHEIQLAQRALAKLSTLISKDDSIVSVLPLDQVRFPIAIARTYAQIHNSDAALKILSQTNLALETLAKEALAERTEAASTNQPSISSTFYPAPSEWTWTLTEIAKTYGQLQNSNVVSEALSKFGATMDSYSDLFNKTEVLIAISEAYLQLEKYDDALRSLVQAQNSAEHFSNLSDRAKASITIAKAYTQLQGNNEAQEILSSAWAEVESFSESPSVKAKILVAIAETYAQLGENDTSLKALTQALSYSSGKVDLLVAVANAYGRLQEINATFESLEQVRAATELLTESPRANTEFLIAIAKAYTQLHKKSTAMEILKKARTITASISESLVKDIQLTAISEGYKDLKAWRQFNLTSAFGDRRDCESYILSVGLTSWAKQRYPELKWVESFNPLINYDGDS